MYPNPVLNDLHLDMFAGEENTLIAEICDISGQVLSSEKFQMKKGNNTYQVSLDALNTGLYFIRFHAGRQNTVKRFVKL